MASNTQRERLTPPPPLWLRTLGYLSLLLVFASSLAQAAHVHGDWLPQTHPHAAVTHAGVQDTSEAACPLCIAMHSALPGSTHLEARITPARVVTLFFTPERSATGRWHFELFSRPPPSV